MTLEELKDQFGPEFNISDLQAFIVADLDAKGMVHEDLIEHVVLATLYRTAQRIAAGHRVEFKNLFSVETKRIKPRTYTSFGKPIEKGERVKLIIHAGKKLREMIKQNTGLDTV